MSAPDVPCADVATCLQCGEALHTSEPLTFIDNRNPGRGGCHARCVDAYHRENDKIKRGLTLIAELAYEHWQARYRSDFTDAQRDELELGFKFLTALTKTL